MSAEMIDRVEELYHQRNEDLEFESITIIEGKTVSGGDYEQVDTERGIPVEQSGDETYTQWPLLWEERDDGTFEMIWQLHAVGQTNVGTVVFVSPHFAEPFSPENMTLRSPDRMSLRFDRISEYETFDL